MRKTRKLRNWAQLIVVARKMRKFAPTRKPVALETLLLTRSGEAPPTLYCTKDLKAKTHLSRARYTLTKTL